MINLKARDNDRIDDRDLPGALQERQALAGRDHGAALVRRWDEADHQFRRVNGHLHLLKLRAALDASFAENVSAVSQNEDQKVA